MRHATPPETLRFYPSQPYPCPYLPDRTARSSVATPAHLVDATTYGQLVRQGFRRSGHFSYGMICPQCEACVSVRVPAARFCPDRSQRRTWLRWAGKLGATERPLVFIPEHFRLYRRYVMARHDEADEDASPENYERFLLASHVDTRLVEFRAPDGRVVIVSLVDVLDDGLSCVYTFYDPDDPRAGLGTWSILWHIAQAQASGMPYVYLGYWIARSRKMAYKARFRPLEGYWRGRWLPFERIEPLFRTVP